MTVLSALVMLKVPSGRAMVSTNTIHVSHIMVEAGLKQEWTCVIDCVLVFVEYCTMARAVSCSLLVKCGTIAQAVSYPLLVKCGTVAQAVSYPLLVK
jgi:hypothetical protein